MSAPGSKQLAAPVDIVILERRSSKIRQGLWALLVLASLCISLFVLWQLRGEIRRHRFSEQSSSSSL